MASSSDCATLVRYRPLDRNGNEVRLLEVQPPTTNDINERLVCRLVHERLTGSSEFAGLSTLYGDVSCKEQILLNGNRVAIPSSVAKALRHVRTVLLPRLDQGPPKPQHDKVPSWLRSLLKNAKHMLVEPSGSNGNAQAPLRIWIDLLCINQRDAREQSERRSTMARAYRRAQMVIGWLGPRDGTSDLAIDIIRAWDGCMPANFGEPGDREAHPENYAPIMQWMGPVAHLTEKPEGITDPKEVPSYKAISSFLTRPYFRNAWILDDMAMARFPTFLVGDEIVSWKQILQLNRVNEDIKDHGATMFPDDLRHLLDYMPLNTVYTFLKEFDKRQRLDNGIPLILNATSSGTSSPSVRSLARSNM